MVGYRSQKRRPVVCLSARPVAAGPMDFFSRLPGLPLYSLLTLMTGIGTSVLFAVSCVASSVSRGISREGCPGIQTRRLASPCLAGYLSGRLRFFLCCRVREANAGWTDISRAFSATRTTLLTSSNHQPGNPTKKAKRDNTQSCGQNEVGL